MTTPADNMRRKPMGEVRPDERPARLFRVPGAHAGFTSRQRDRLACREAGKMTESPGGASKRTGIWGIPA